MKLCITSQGDTLDSQIDPRFGRCSFFIIIDVNTLEFEAINNNNMQSAGGAGIQSGQLVADKGVDAVITGNCGPNAFQTLSVAGINIITGVSGSVSDAVTKYKGGELSSTKHPSVDSHFGMRRSK